MKTNFQKQADRILSLIKLPNGKGDCWGCGLIFPLSELTEDNPSPWINPPRYCKECLKELIPNQV